MDHEKTADVFHAEKIEQYTRCSFVSVSKQQIIYMTVVWSSTSSSSKCFEGVRLSSVDTWRAWTPRNVLMRSFSCPYLLPLYSLVCFPLYIGLCDQLVLPAWFTLSFFPSLRCSSFIFFFDAYNSELRYRKMEVMRSFRTNPIPPLCLFFLWNYAIKTYWYKGNL